MDIPRKQRTAINKSRRLGCKHYVLIYETRLDTFRRIYRDTILRASASSQSFFNDTYFRDLSARGNHLHLMGFEQNDRIISAAIVFECNGVVQAHLGGTLSECMTLSPICLLCYKTAPWAKTRGSRFFHVGGGLGGADDGLFRFKSAYSSQRHDYHTLRLVVHPEDYHDLVTRRTNELSLDVSDLTSTSFYPAYRYEPTS